MTDPPKPPPKPNLLMAAFAKAENLAKRKSLSQISIEEASSELVRFLGTNGIKLPFKVPLSTLTSERDRINGEESQFRDDSSKGNDRFESAARLRELHLIRAL